MPERSKGVDSSSTVFALVGSNPTADSLLHFLELPCFAFQRGVCSRSRVYTLLFLYPSFSLPLDSSIARTPTVLAAQCITRLSHACCKPLTRLLQSPWHVCCTPSQPLNLFRAAFHTRFPTRLQPAAFCKPIELATLRTIGVGLDRSQ